MMTVLQDYWDRLAKLLWRTPLSAMPMPLALLVRVLRLIYMVVSELADGQLNLRASSLVFTTFLSLIPLLAVSFSVLKAFGVHNRLEYWLQQFLSPLGERAGDITQRIVEFVDQVNGGMLGGVGLLALMFTVVSLVHKIEKAFNASWRVRRSRRALDRFTGYLSVIIIGPVLIFAALGATASLMNTALMQGLVAVESLGLLVLVARTALPYVMVIAAFTFLYVFVPNTSVKLGSAFFGAVIAGVLWESAGWIFASFVVNSPNYTTIYSSFAVLFLFMLWVYISWLVLLVGATVSFYHQNPQYQGRSGDERPLSSRMQESLALHVMSEVAGRFAAGEEPLDEATLATRLAVPRAMLARVVDPLHRSGLILLAHNCADDEVLLPARDLDSITLSEVLQAVRWHGEGDGLAPQDVRLNAAVETIEDTLMRATDAALSGKSVRDLVATERASRSIGVEEVHPVPAKHVIRESAI